MTGRLLRMLRTVRHVRPRQLWARLCLMEGRKWRVRWATRYRRRLMNAPLPTLTLREPLPLPVFPPRCHLAEVQGTRYTLSFLNEDRTFTHPFDWHPADFAFGTRLWLLNLHYMEFLEALPDDAFVEVVEDWMAHVPPYRAGYWLDDWNSYALSIRCVVWMQQFAVRHAALAPAFQERVLDSLMRQLQFLVKNVETDIGGNHLIKNIKALLWAGRFWQHEEAARWRALGGRLLTKELEEQILQDGMHYERSPAYHAQVFADLLECFLVLEEGALKEQLHFKLCLMAQGLVDVTHPDGYVSLFNDGGLHMTYAPATCLQAWKQHTGEHVDPRRVFAFQDAGYYGLRTKDEYVLVDCGKVAPDFLTAHGHGDIFSFEWSLSGQRFIVDAGVYEYNPGSRRAYSRSTRAHNTLTLDGLDQCEFWGAFRMARRARVEKKRYGTTSDGFVLSGIHDGYRHLPGRPLHQRTYDVRPGRIHIVDEVQQGEGQHAVARLLLHPSCTVDKQNGRLLLKQDGILVRFETSGEAVVEDAVWYPDFGVEQSCLQLVVSYGKAPCRGSLTLERVDLFRR